MQIRFSYSKDRLMTQKIGKFEFLIDYDLILKEDEVIKEWKTGKIDIY